jgi:hypothetical protein
MTEKIRIQQVDLFNDPKSHLDNLRPFSNLEVTAQELQEKLAQHEYVLGEGVRVPYFEAYWAYSIWQHGIKVAQLRLNKQIE